NVLAVQHLVPGRRFDRVTYGVPEVEDRAFALLALILRDDGRLDLHRAPHDPLQRWGVLRKNRRVLPLQKRKVLGVGDHAVLHRPGESRRATHARYRAPDLTM